MRESDIFPPVRDWLKAQGYEVYVEKFDADVIGIKDFHIIVVELKPCLTMGLFNQLIVRASWANEVWGAVASEPRMHVSQMRHRGFGLLCLHNGKLRIKAKARPQPWGWHRRRAYRFKKLIEDFTPAGPDAMAGIPSGGHR